MSTKQKNSFECIGGPLCGRRISGAGEGVVYEDDDMNTHFYRLIRVVKNDHSARAIFYHYFGTDFRRAQSAEPMLLPPQRLFRKKNTR